MPESKPRRDVSQRVRASIRVSEVASRQWGVIGSLQLRDCGVSRAGVRRWLGRRALTPIFPGVYAVGHWSVPTEGRLTAALLYAGPGTALSYATAAWWWKLIPRLPGVIHVSTLSRVRGCPGVCVHHPRSLTPVYHRRLPVTMVARTLLDFATLARDSEVRLALSEAEYLRRLDVAAVRAEIGRGRAGSARLGRMLARHEPRLARTRSQLERLFVDVLERHHVPLPEVNHRIGRMTVDAVWPAQRVAVEIDGYSGHRTRAQLARDCRRELHVRRAGFTHARYTEEQLEQEPALVAGDVLDLLSSSS